MVAWNNDLVIAVAYFSIPAQILVSMLYYPRLRNLEMKLLGLGILFSLFILMCGTGHLLQHMGLKGVPLFEAVHTATALVSLLTALYLLPLVPNLFYTIDRTLQEIEFSQLNEESKRTLVTFMAFLCHEIRNPLFAITTSICFIQDSAQSLSDDQYNGLQSIDHSAKLMLRLVNDVLDMTKLQSGKLALEMAHFDLSKLLEGVANTVKTQIQCRHDGNVAFEYRPGHFITSRQRTTFWGDSARLLQILYNLLSNANKFTRMGRITFAVQLCDPSVAVKEGLINVGNISDAEVDGDDDDDDDDGLTQNIMSSGEEIADQMEDGLLGLEEGLRNGDYVVAKFVVSDTGCGIAKERLDRIFKPFAQARLSDYRLHGGTGLGLSISQRIITAMGGSIQVRSNEKHGSTFTVYLPLQVVQDTSGPSTEPIRLPDSTDLFLDASVKSPNTSLSSFDNSVIDDLGSPLAESPCRVKTSPRQKQQQFAPFHFAPTDCVVLVVDDNEINRKLLGRMLDQFNLEFEFAVNGHEAVEIMRSSRNHTGDRHALQFGMILMDMSMPVMDGREATSQIRDMGLNLPIVALTAAAVTDGRSDMIQAGATEFATKPILRTNLYDTCRRYLPPSGSSERQ